MNFHRISCFVLLCFALLSSAQSGLEPPPTREVSLFSFNYASGHRTVYMNDAKKGYTEIALSTANIRGPFKTFLTEAGEVMLHRKEENEDGTFAHPPILRARIPEGVKEPLLVLIPGPGPEPYVALVLDGSAQGFPAGTHKLINFSNTDIRGAVGQTKVFAPSGDIEVIDPTGNKERLLQVVFQYRIGNSWKTFGSTRWVNDKSGRTLLCAYPNPKNQRMQIKGIPLRGSD